MDKREQRCEGGTDRGGETLALWARFSESVSKNIIK